MLVGRHSDASVTDGEFEFDFAVIDSDRLHGNDNFSLLGKLDGVGTEIHQNLLQAQGVTHEMERRVGSYAEQDFQSLLVSAHADHAREVFENFLETEPMRSMVSFPASILEKSRISLMIPSSEWAERSIFWR